MIREIAATVSKGSTAGSCNSEPITTAFGFRNSGRGRRDVRDNKAARYCTHCKRSGHNADQCFKLVGYPDWYKGVRDSTKGRVPVRIAANAVGQDSCDTPLEETSCREVSPNQVDTGWVQALVAQEMMKWMQGKQSKQGADDHSSPSSQSDGNQISYAHFAGITLAGSHSSACCSVSQACSGSWIVDTGASDHMTHDPHLFCHLTKLSKPTLVTLPMALLNQFLTLAKLT